MNVAAIILAGGNSTRFEDGHKLLAPLDGIPLVRHVTTVLAGSNVSDIVLVTGKNTDDVVAAAGTGRWRNVENNGATVGLSSSLRLGIQTVDASADGILVALGDMPGISTGLVQSLLVAFEKTEGRSIVFPIAHDGQRGHPIIWPRALFAELQRLSGDTGGKRCWPITAIFGIPYRVPMLALSPTSIHALTSRLMHLRAGPGDASRPLYRYCVQSERDIGCRRSTVAKACSAKNI